MMDIVERARHQAKQLREYGYRSLSAPSADDIDGYADEIARLRAEVERLREGLEDIVHPIVKLKQEADRSGVKLSGVAALSISNDANYLKNIARAALNGEAQ